MSDQAKESIGMQGTGKHGEDKPSWFERKENVDKIWYGVLAIAGLLTVSEFAYEHHPHFDIEKIPEFFEIFGFLAFVIIVFAGKALRKVIMRDEDYYDRG